MSRFFKFLGISSAVGVVAYGIIKYKHDEKFKEKVDDVVEKAEEKANKVMTKASDFVLEHPNLFLVGLFTVTIVPAVIHSVKSDRRRQEMMQKAYEDFKANADDLYDEECERINEEARTAAQKQVLIENIRKNPSDYLVVSKEAWESCQKALENKPEPIEPETDIFDRWKEDYRDTWDEVHELTKRIDLAPGESYTIEEPRQLGLDTDTPVISHMIYGHGCYPPEVKDDQFIP